MTKRLIINQALKLVRLYWGLTQIELSQRTGVSQSQISEIEKEIKPVTLEVLEKYSFGLSIKMSDLMFFAEEIEGQPVEAKGRLIFASGALDILERLKPNEPTPA